MHLKPGAPDAGPELLVLAFCFFASLTDYSALDT